MQFYSLSNFMQDCPPFPGLHDYVPLVAGASLTAANVLVKQLADIAICWDGGRSVFSFFFCYILGCIR